MNDIKKLQIIVARIFKNKAVRKQKPKQEKMRCGLLLCTFSEFSGLSKR